MTKVALTENSVIEISIKVRLTVSNLSIASKVYYDTEEEHLVDSKDRIWSPLVMLENIGAGQYRTLTSTSDFEEKLGLTVHSYPEIETYITEK
jgi:hypothetical protein